MMYLIQVSVYTLLMWLIYTVLLRNKAMHGFNRVYLLSAVVLPIVLPFLSLPKVWQQQLNLYTPANYTLPEVMVGGRGNQPVADSFSWLTILMYVYVGVAVLLLVWQMMKLLKLYRVIKRSEQEQHGDHVLLKNTSYGPGSWGKYIFLPSGNADEAIIAHEYAHIKYKHTADILFLSIIQVAFWPNIFISIIRKELIQVHEFQADSTVNMSGDDYSKLLLSSVFSTCTLPLSHSFIIHPIKRRIMMLQNKHRPQRARRVLAILSLSLFIGCVATLQSCETQKKQMEPELVTDMNTLSKQPEFPGGNVELPKYLGKEITYPKQAFDQKLEGRVLVQFVIDEKGDIVNVVEVGKTKANPLLAEEALKVVRNMPSWMPGEKDGVKVRTQYTLPIVFKIPVDGLVTDDATVNNTANPVPTDVKEVSRIDRRGDRARANRVITK